MIEALESRQFCDAVLEQVTPEEMKQLAEAAAYATLSLAGSAAYIGWVVGFNGADMASPLGAFYWGVAQEGL